MTTIKEFEEQKQEIINLIYDRYGRDTILKSVKQLHPPRSTCASCKFLGKKLINRNELNYCNRRDEISSVKSDDFGCIHHSDYEEVEK